MKFKRIRSAIGATLLWLAEKLVYMAGYITNLNFEFKIDWDKINDV